MNKKLLFGMVAMLTASALQGQNPAADELAVQKEIAKAREVISRYVNVRQEIARVSNEWSAYQEMTNRRISLYEDEISRLNAQIEANREDTTQAERVIAGVREEIANLRAANDIIKNALPELEGRLSEIAQYFPIPLREKVQPLLQRIGKSRSASDGMAIVVGILNEVDKFNSEFTPHSMQKTLPSGETKLVDVIYVGLAAAYYADREGLVGGFGVPAAGEWKWEEVDEMTAARIRASINYYEGNIKPSMLVDLPVKVQHISFSN